MDPRVSKLAYTLVHYSTRIEKGEKVARQHEKRCSGRVAHFQLVSSGDKLGTIPKTCRGLYCQAVGSGGYKECKPAHQVVY